MKLITKRDRIEVTLLLFSILSIVFLKEIYNNGYSEPYLVIIALIILIGGLTIKKFSQLLARIWFVVFGLIGGFSNRIILSIVFFLILSPLAFFRRIFSKKGKSVIQSESQFLEINKTFSSKDFKNPW